MEEAKKPSIDADDLARELAARDAVIVSLRALNENLAGRNAALESVVINHAEEIEILKRRLYGTRSERSGTNELQLTLGAILADQERLQKELEARVGKIDGEDNSPSSPDPKKRAKPAGRRDLSLSKLPQVVVEIDDPALASQGKRIGYEESRQLIYRRGGLRVLVKRTVKYELSTATGTTVLGVETPVTLFPRALCHTSVIAWLAVEKFALGVPRYRLEQHMAQEETHLDRGTMCRYDEELGNTLGATIVHAMLEDARTCSVLSTDATGASIQPGPSDDGLKRACKKRSFLHHRRRLRSRALRIYAGA